MCKKDWLIAERSSTTTTTAIPVRVAFKVECLPSLLPLPKLQRHTMWLSDGDEDSSVVARRRTRKTSHSDVALMTAEGELSSRTLPVRVISRSNTLNIASKRRTIRPHEPHSNLTLLQYVDLTTRPQLIQLITLRQQPSSWLVHVTITCHRNSQ